MKKNNLFAFIILQVALIISSLGGIFSKMAGKQEFLSIPFFIYYGCLIAVLFIYAIIWQRVLKKIDLIVAYACKGEGIIFSMTWGYLFFDEVIRPGMIIGAIIVIVGVFIFVYDDILKKDEGKIDEEKKENN